jgi:uncharacterized C2H2 Zn-finger protein
MDLPYSLLILAVLLAAMFLAQVILRKRYNFQCADCGHIFSPSALVMTLTPHRFGTKLLKCPECGKVTWAARMPKKQ